MSKEKLFSKEEKNKLKEENKSDEKKEKLNDILNKTFKNTSSVFALSIISRVVNLLCNIILVRRISKDAYGIAKIYFEFAFSLVCFFPRETIRKTAQKFCPDKDTNNEQKKYYLVCQLYSLITMLMIIYCFILFFGFIVFDRNNNLEGNYIQLFIYIISGMCEITAEPIIIYMNLHMENIQFGITLGNFIRIITNVFFVVIFKFDLWSFTCSRFLGSISYFCYIFYLGKIKYKIHFKNFIPENPKLFFEKNKIINGVDISPLKEILFQFIKLTFLNMILSNCENLILSFVLQKSNEEKSEYSFIVENFSIITRLLLKPIEDVFYNLINKIKNYEKQNENTKNNYNLTFKVLHLFIKILLIFGTLLIGYYLLFGKDIIELVYSKKWANNVTDKIGCAYSIYMAIISINGIIECFANATNDNDQMNISYLLLTLNSCILAFLMIIFSKWDICGLILANAISMVFRINGNLYIIFCGKKIEKTNKNTEKNDTTLIKDIKNFQENCYLSNSSIILSIFCLICGYFVKKAFYRKMILIKCAVFGFVGTINVIFIGVCEFRSLKKAIKDLKDNKIS